QEVVSLYGQLRSVGTQIITSDYVLDEFITLLFRRENFQEAARFVSSIIADAEGGNIRVERVEPARFDAAWNLRQQFQDKPLISFTDLTSMVIMRELGVSDILTEDDHFLHVGFGFQMVQ